MIGVENLVLYTMCFWPSFPSKMIWTLNGQIDLVLSFVDEYQLCLRYPICMVWIRLNYLGYEFLDVVSKFCMIFPDIMLEEMELM